MEVPITILPHPAQPSRSCSVRIVPIQAARSGSPEESIIQERMWSDSTLTGLRRQLGKVPSVKRQLGIVDQTTRTSHAVPLRAEAEALIAANERQVEV